MIIYSVTIALLSFLFNAVHHAVHHNVHHDVHHDVHHHVQDPPSCSPCCLSLWLATTPLFSTTLHQSLIIIFIFPFPNIMMRIMFEGFLYCFRIETQT